MARKRRVIIIEGHDKAGKSSIIEAIRPYLNYYTVKYFGRLNKSFGFFPDYLDALFCSGQDVLIFDRFFMSEMAYGAVVRRGEIKISEKEIRAMVLILKRCFNVTYVSCVSISSKDELDHHDIIKVKNFDDLCSEYIRIADWMEAHKFNVVHYDKTLWNVDVFAEKLAAEIFGI